jgi:hypothetical protein
MMETLLRPAESRHVGTLDHGEMSPAERLQRLADAFESEPEWAEQYVAEAVAAEQHRPATRAAVSEASPVIPKRSFPGRRKIALSLAVLVAVTGVVGAVRLTLIPSDGHPAISLATAIETKLLEKTPLRQPSGLTRPAELAETKPNDAAPAPNHPVAAAESHPAVVAAAPSAPRLLLDTPRGSRPTYVTGETLVLAVQPIDDAYVYCFYQDSSGNVARIFPNRFQSGPFVAGNQRLEIPSDGEDSFVIRFDPPGGKETISCIAAGADVWQKLPDNLKAADLSPLAVSDLDEMATRFREVAGVPMREVRMLVNVIR